ncbi:MAG: hypothetical protein IJ220_04695 [Clostridia bacterium]|nr:hypothetical protein [Clostridia bacterium]
MIDSLSFNKSNSDIHYFVNQITTVYNNLPQNIDIFNDLIDINGKTSEIAQKVYFRLLSIMQRYINNINIRIRLDNSIPSLKNTVDEDGDVILEWPIRNNYRIGFVIDIHGNISFWRIFKDGTITNTVSDIISENSLEEKIDLILEEVICLT